MIWGILLAVLSLMPGGQGELLLFGIPHIDKVGHFGMYAIWTFLVYRGWIANSEMPAQKIMWLTFLFGTLTGALLEFGQYAMTMGRTFEMWDIVANTLGSGFGAFLLRKFLP